MMTLVAVTMTIVDALVPFVAKNAANTGAAPSVNIATVYANKYRPETLPSARRHTFIA